MEKKKTEGPEGRTEKFSKSGRPDIVEMGCFWIGSAKQKEKKKVRWLKKRGMKAS